MHSSATSFLSSAGRSVIIAYLPTEPLRSLRAAVRGRGMSVVPVRSASGLRAQLHRFLSVTVVIDPSRCSGRTLERIGLVLAQNPALRVVVYTSFSPVALGGYKTLLPYNVTALLLRGIDDSTTQIHAAVTSPLPDIGAVALLEILEERLAKLPSGLAHAITSLFLRDRLSKVEELARAAGVPWRTLTRMLARHDLPSAETLIHVARVMRACYYLRRSNVPVGLLASFLGYRTSRGITREMRRMIGYLPRKARHAIDEPPIISLLSAYLALESKK